ncbi:MAG: hypothetical protein KME67_10835 [Candidatus Thiodiazotropha sp. (ex Codakia orbicularis)]|nr:hypothetical protein [Candidatus Thiodiazotropha sp. (ex Codakia orbicularis)]
MPQNIKFKPVEGDPFMPQGVKLQPVSGNPFESVEDEGFGEQILNSFKKAGQDLKSGYEGSASSFYNTGANIVSLINRAADYLTQETGIGTMSKDTALGHAEKWLRNASKQVAPEDYPEDIPGKIYAGFGSAPVALAEYAAGIKALGPVLGFGTVDALRAADQGPEEAAGAFLKGATVGKIFQGTGVLNPVPRSVALGATGATQAAAEGGDTADIVSSATVLGTLGLTGGKGPIRLRDLHPKRLVPVEGNPFKKFKSVVGNPFEKTTDITRAVEQWRNKTDLQRAQDKIGEKRKLHVAMDQVFDRFRQSVADDLHGVYRFERKLSGDINPAGPYETTRLTRAAHSIVEGAMTLGAPKIKKDGSTIYYGRPLKQILDPVAKDLDNFTLYAVGRSAKELQAQGREHLFTPKEVNAMVNLENPKFKKAFDQYLDWNEQIVNFAEQKGIINPETRALWKRTQYLPFYRHMEKGAPSERTEGQFAGIGKLRGGKGHLKDPLGNMVQNASYLMTEAIRNEARLKVVDFAKQHEGGETFLHRVTNEVTPVKIDKGQVQRFVQQILGIDPAKSNSRQIKTAARKLTKAFEARPDYVKFWLHNQTPKGDNVIAVMRDGKPEFYEVTDPLLFRSFESLNRPAKNWLIKFLGGFRRIGQSSVTVTADFMAANLARDTLMGGVMSNHGFKPFLDSIRGMKSRLAKDKDYQEFIANGGGFSSFLLDEGAFRKHLERFYKKKGIDYRSVMDSPSKLLHGIETITDAFEMSTRLGEYKRARARGEDPRKAAYSAREVSTDFAMRGDSEVIGAMYDTIMFLKAGVNGLDRAYRGFTKDPNRGAIAAKTGLLALTSAALYAVNQANPLYDRLEDWDKDTHWHFFIPKQDVDPNQPFEDQFIHLRYPKIWEIGAVASVTERTLEQILKEEPDPAEWAMDVLRVTGDLFKFDYVPQALKPLYEQHLNRNRFTGRPIETLSMQNLAPFARAKPYTSPALVELGLATKDLPRDYQVSPARAEALLRGYFNTWATYGLDLIDSAVTDDQPEMRLDDYPVIKRFYVGSPAKRTKYETMFYDMLREATELRRTMRHMDKVVRPDIADEIEQSRAIKEYPQLNRMNKELQGIHREIKQIYNSDEIGPEQKRIAIDRLTRERNKVLEMTVRDVDRQR